MEIVKNCAHVIETFRRNNNSVMLRLIGMREKVDQKIYIYTSFIKIAVFDSKFLSIESLF